MALHSWPWAHAVHELPLAPQAELVGVMHWPAASQQPDAHDDALHVHAPWPQVWPAAHAAHAAPAVPHAEAASVVTQ